MKRSLYCLCLITLLWSSWAQATTTQKQVFQMCANAFLHYTEVDIIDESPENRFQHIDAHCALVQFTRSASWDAFSSNLLASSIVALQELHNQNPNYKELTLGVTKTFSQKAYNYTAFTGATLDGHIGLRLGVIF